VHKLSNQLMSKHFTKPKDGTTIHSWINDIKQHTSQNCTSIRDAVCL